jgi:aspartate racemase
LRAQSQVPCLTEPGASAAQLDLTQIYGKDQLLSTTVLSLPTGKPQPATPTSPFELYSSVLAKDLGESLRQFSLSEQVPLWTVFLSAFHVLLLRYTSQEEIEMVCSLAASLVGPVNGSFRMGSPFLLRTDLSGDPSFRSLLRTHAAVLGSLACADSVLPPAQDLNAQSDANGASVLASFAYCAPGTATKSDLSQPPTADEPIDLHLGVEDCGEDLSLTLVCNPDLFDSGGIRRVLRNLQTLLRGVATDPGQPLSRLPVLSEDEKQQVLVEWNQTDAEYPHDKCLHELIEVQAERVAERAALVLEDRALTYCEFNTRANQLAHYLQARGIAPNARVGICLQPSFDFAVAVLAVLKAGGACVPLDPQYPPERLAYMLQDVQAHVVITEKGMLPQAVPPSCEMLFLADNPEVLSSQPTSNPASGAAPGDIAYVLYTSGSTGKPRGVLLTHGGLVNYNFNATRTYSVTPDDRVLQFCSVSFDIAVEELFITWLSGATLVLKSQAMPLAVPEFLEWVERQRVTILDLPTAYWHEWANHVSEMKKPAPQHLRLVIVGGEKASAKAYSAWRKAVHPALRWFNSYGPTEASVCATGIFDPPEPVPDNIPIGRPLPNVRVYLLDRHLNPVPVGVPGELHIGGVGVAQGYLNRPDLTAEKFIPDPFSSVPGARMYCTGDLARYLPSGEIEFLGRRDDQVKIRGFRVELGEIESALATHPGVREVAVLAREDVPGNKRIVAYVVPANGAKLITADLRRHLQQQLPEYMVPSVFVALETMPLTPNGKINRRGLPAPEGESLPAETVAASDALQLQLVRTWEGVLGKRPIGIRDNFFDLGGHSLLAARLMHRIGQTLGKTLPLAMLFQAPTVEQLAAALRQNGWAQHFSSLVAIQPEGSQPPFFCIHGVGGNVVGFRELARRMAPDYPFYGLQAQGLDGTRPCHRRIEEMAAHYLHAIHGVQPKGPYFLGGFSFGGLVAYEMAQQLHAHGEEVGLLALFDTYPGRLNAVTTSLLKTLLVPSWQHWFRDLPKAVRKRIRWTVRGFRLPQVLRSVQDTNIAAAENYVLRPYPGKATLLRATQHSLRSSDDPHAAWPALVGSLEILAIPGDHNDMLRVPQVDDLAERLKACIDKGRVECEQARVALKLS